MDFENMNIWCWLIAVLIGLICGIFGYLIGKTAKKAINPADLKLLEEKNEKLAADLEECNKKLASNVEASSFAATAVPFDAKAAIAALGKRIKQDDLKVIEGIGPKIQGLFHNFDIKTWQALSTTSVSKCQEVLDSGGERYKIHDPASWPMQAKMCYEGKWKELFRWQEEHKHGKL
jgi:predicted flap endonuclease-1-like 5' DNA nuclease